jgi:hypothetical protein
MRLFHFSDDPDIDAFVPRPVLIPSQRAAGYEWLNGPLVWAIDEAHEPLYLFPRECPRILIWRTAGTTPDDDARWFAGSPAKMIAYVEKSWLDSLASETIYRYELPPGTFEDLEDAGMWVSRHAVHPARVDALSDLPAELKLRNVELRSLDSLLMLKGIWQTSLHASGIRLRNARDWENGALS